MTRVRAYIIGLWLCASPMPGLAAEIFVHDWPQVEIYIVGKIDQGDDETFLKVLKPLVEAKTWIANVIIYSPGGNAKAAMNIGRLIRELHLATRGPVIPLNVPGTRSCVIHGPGELQQRIMEIDIKTNQGNPGCDCASACFLIWAAGTFRFGEVIGLHRPYFDRREYAHMSLERAQEEYARLMNVVRKYLSDMDIPDDLVRAMFATDSTSMKYLSREQIHTLRRQPYMDEMVIARCGKEPDVDINTFVWAMNNARKNARAKAIMDQHNKMGNCISELKRQRFLLAAEKYLRRVHEGR